MQKKKEWSQKYNANIFHAYMFCATKLSTGHTVKGERSRDVHSWPAHNVAEQILTSYKYSDFI